MYLSADISIAVGMRHKHYTYYIFVNIKISFNPLNRCQLINKFDNFKTQNSNNGKTVGGGGRGLREDLRLIT